MRTTPGHRPPPPLASAPRRTGWGLAALLVLAGAASAQGPLPRPLSALPGAAVASGFSLTGGSAPSAARRLGSSNPHGDLSIACEACHTPEGWRPLRADPDFAHGPDTGYPLEARHAQAACASCHLGLRFTGLEDLGTDCATCHVDVHRSALGDACQSCHAPTDWADVDGVEVHALTAFPLTGAHLQVSCETCHTAGVDAAAFGPLPADCLGCHEEDLQSTEASLVPHVSSGFPADCETCHHTAAWGAGGFDHAARAGGFALVGAHEALACSSCHLSGPDFEALWDPASQDDCLSCHAEDRASAAVDHAPFPDTCTTCHSVATWGGVSADHAVLSGGFALTGSHLALDCSACHLADLTPIWTPPSESNCFTCHESDYQATAGGLVDHVAGGFPTTCDECHTTQAWQSAQFDHATASGGFSLVGAHGGLACASCHSGAGGEVPWDPAGPNDCQACHAEDAAAAQPDHSGFPTTCTDCHGPDQWQGATLDHPQFPIFSGRHEGEWDSCQTCHTQPSNYQVFSCLTCHEHNREDMDDEHDRVGGYVYQSAACYACHPDGEDLR